MEKTNKVFPFTNQTRKEPKNDDFEFIDSVKRNHIKEPWMNINILDVLFKKGK